MAQSSKRPGQLPTFRFVGHSGSGKTTVLEGVIAELRRRGLRVAVVKDTHHDVQLDQPGKDTWRFAEAGAEQVLLATDRQLTLFQRRQRRADLSEVAALVAGTADVLLAEGFRQSAEPAVLVWRAAMSRPSPALSGEILAVVGDAPPAVRAPVFNTSDQSALANLLLTHIQSTAARQTNLPMSRLDQ